MLLKPILERSKLVINLAGTAYHTGKGLQAELTLSALLNLDHPYIWYHKNIDKNTYLDIAHRQSFGKRSRASSLESEIGYLLERKARAREILPRQAIIIRSHTHAGYRSIDEDGIIAISTPSWKIQDHFAKVSTSPNRLTPDNLGAVGLRLYDEPVDGNNVTMVKYLYKHPELQ